MIPRPSFASIAATLALVISVVNGFHQTSQAQSLPQAAVGTAFTYQGRLDNNGAPANGAYDFEFALFDAASGGSQIGATVTVNGVAVSNGIFTVPLDFGNPFWQQQTYLEVRVRPSGGGGFTTLTPRQPVSAAPVASALPGVYTDQAGQFVGVGRTTRIVIREVFGVNADFGAADASYGGMSINTVAPAGLPFYGYATAGLFRAWTTYNPNPDNVASPNPYNAHGRYTTRPRCDRCCKRVPTVSPNRPARMDWSRPAWLPTAVRQPRPFYAVSSLLFPYRLPRRPWRRLRGTSPSTPA